MTTILIVGETSDGDISSITFELLAAGRKLADQVNGTVVAAFLGDAHNIQSNEIFVHGADSLHLIQDSALTLGATDAQLAALHAFCQDIQPTAVLVGKTETGSDLGPRLGYRLGTAVAQGCSDVWFEKDDRLRATRAVYGGCAVARLVFGPGNPQIVTMQPGAFEPTQADASRSGETTHFEPKLDASVTRVSILETVHEKSEGLRLEDANVIVSGGRGLGGTEPFEQLGELATLLGGAVGASRAACDAGWIDYTHQIGMTGKNVSPDLYIAVGISGATQHISGCSRAKNIVAINTDEEANIFRQASLGVIGDWSTILPDFLDEVKKLNA